MVTLPYSSVITPQQTSASQQNGPSQQLASRCGRLRVFARISCYLACVKCICIRRRRGAEAPPSPRKIRKCLVVGPTGGGKTLLLQRMAIRDSCSKRTEPTRGFRQQRVTHKSFDYEMLEVGGSFQKYWHRYIPNAQALIFVVGTQEGANPIDCLAEAGATLAQFLRDHVPSWWPVVILVNDKDHANSGQSITRQAARHALSLEGTDAMQRVHLEIFVCSAAAQAPESAHALARPLDWLAARLADD